MENEFDFAVRLDGDGQHDAAHLPALVAPVLDGEADVAVGSRYLGDGGYRQSAHRQIGNRVLAWAASLVTRERVTDPSSGFQALNRRAIELKKPGTYPISELVKQATAKINGVAGRYASYVGNELSKVKEPVNPGDKHQSNMENTGSVERAFGDQVTTQDVTETAAVSALGMLNIPGADYAKTVKTAVETVRMKIPLPKNSYIIDSLVTFSWHPANSAEQYVVTLTDEDGRTLFEIVAKNTVRKVDLSPYHL